MVNPHTHPPLVTGKIVHAIGNGLAELLVREVMHLDLLRLSLGLPFRARILKFPDQFLLFRIDRHHRLMPLLERDHLLADVFKLGVAIRMRRAFPSLAIGLQAVARPFQQGRDRAVRHSMVLPPEFLGQLARTLARPAQGRFRMASRRRIDQRIQGFQQSGIRFRQRLATAARTANPNAHDLLGVSLAILHFAGPHGDRVACQARSDRYRGHATPAQVRGFGSGPLPAHPLVHHRDQCQILLSNPFDRGRILHAPTIPETPKTGNTNLLKLFFRGA